MRTLLILRGAPASGKDTWVRNNHLEPYMLSADQLRLSRRSPILNKEGQFQITQAFDGEVWTQLFELLEERMQRGEFVVVNGTHYRAELIQRYKKLIDTYRYRAYIVDFTNVSKEECIRRNENRPEFQRVPNSVIEKMCAVFEAERDGVFKEVSNRYKVLDPSNALEQLSGDLLYKLPSEFEKVYVFGDIHGCFEPIKEFFETHEISPNCEYIFTGDYIDRGIQNKEVLEFIESHLNDKNFMFLEGNHENWLKKWCSKTYTHFEPTQEEKKILKKYTPKNFVSKMYSQNIKSNEFLTNTVSQIESIDKSRLRQICRKLSQFTWFNFGPNNYLVCHGGIPCVPNQFISTDEFIKGVGKYEDTEKIYSSWTTNTQSNEYLVHAHRNVFKVDIVDRCVNLCDEPELGEYMRVLEINKDGSFELIKIKNNTFNPECRKIQERTNTLNVKTSDGMLENLNKSKWVQKKILNNGIVSYNFTRDAFYKAHWDEVVCKARGLFVDVKSDKVVARGYDKFFSW